MKKNLTHITFLIDRSGSMTSIKFDMEGGLKSFVEEQKKITGDITTSLYQFDDVFETVGENKDLSLLDTYQLIPRNMTALYDALGKSIIKTGKMLSDLAEEDRPEKVMFIIITDGEENSSREFSQSQIKEMIQHQTDKYNWQFVYLGANQDAITVADGIGIDRDKSMTYSANTKGVTNSLRSFSKMSANYRNASTMDFAASFDDDDRQKAI